MWIFSGPESGFPGFGNGPPGLPGVERFEIAFRKNDIQAFHPGAVVKYALVDTVFYPRSGDMINYREIAERRVGCFSPLNNTFQPG